MKDKITESFKKFNPATGNVTNTQPAATTVEFNPFISKYTSTVSSPPILESLKVTIDSSQGAWIIFSARWDYKITAPCKDGSGFNVDLSAGGITTNQQEYFVDTASLLTDFDCDSKDFKGEYKLTLRLYANPMTPSGQLDTNRKQSIKRFSYDFKF